MKITTKFWWSVNQRKTRVLQPVWAAEVLLSHALVMGDGSKCTRFTGDPKLMSSSFGDGVGSFFRPFDGSCLKITIFVVGPPEPALQHFWVRKKCDARYYYNKETKVSAWQRHWWGFRGFQQWKSDPDLKAVPRTLLGEHLQRDMENLVHMGSFRQYNILYIVYIYIHTLYLCLYSWCPKIGHQSWMSHELNEM